MSYTAHRRGITAYLFTDYLLKKMSSFGAQA
jgi:hypothetical protein